MLLIDSTNDVIVEIGNALAGTVVTDATVTARVLSDAGYVGDAINVTYDSSLGKYLGVLPVLSLSKDKFYFVEIVIAATVDGANIRKVIRRKEQAGYAAD